MRILKIYLLSFQMYNMVWLPVVTVLYITSQNVYLDIFTFWPPLSISLIPLAWPPSTANLFSVSGEFRFIR